MSEITTPDYSGLVMTKGDVIARSPALYSKGQDDVAISIFQKHTLRGHQS